MKKERTLSNAQHKALDSNDFIEEVIGDKIIYTKDFYIVMYKKMEYEKKSAIEAYESMGFDTKLFGKNKAYKAAQRTKERIKDGQYLVNPYNYDGSAPRESMGTLTPEQEAAYYKARTIYLERELHHQQTCFKKIIQILGYVLGKRTFRLEIRRHFNIHISVKRARYVMQSMNLVAKRPKKDAYKKQATHKHICSAHPNHVNQDFKVAPRTIILTDITYLYYGLNRNPIYLCAFKDGHTSEILGYSISLKMDVSLVNTAYENMMVKHKHEFKAKTKVYIHSDQRSQYLATSFKELLEDDGFIQSMSARGNSYDNAPIESFF